ncbi:MAG: VC0807 family protein [Bdellovibrionota bacterium]
MATHAKSSTNTGFSHILVNIILPVYILNKGTKWGLTPTNALVLALALPLFSGVYSIFKNKKMDFISLLGLLNILISGTLSLMALGGIWFAVKEALFPLLIGVFVLFSSYGKNPFFESLFLNPAAFDVEKIQQKITETNKEFDFKNLMKKSTQLLSLSFLMSALLNFFLALKIFTPLDETLATEQKQEILNQQLGQMTMYSLLVILIPSIIFLGAILFYTFKKMTALTGLATNDLFIKEVTKA